MLINFRQGIIDGTDFIHTYTTGLGIHATGAEPLIVTIAKGEQNIEIVVKTSIEGAFNLSSPYTTTYWLFLEVGKLGDISFGYTDVEPLFGTKTPSNIKNNQFFYDTDAMQMRQWNSDFRRFSDRDVVFLAKVLVDGSIDYYSENRSQIDIYENYPKFQTGRLLYDNEQKAIRDYEGKFLLTSSTVYTGGALNSGINLEKGTIVATATENISSNTIVKLTGMLNTIPQISIADYEDTKTGVLGFVSSSVTAGDMTTVALQGVVVNEDWDWDARGADIGTAVWIGTGSTKGHAVIHDPAKDNVRLKSQPNVARVIGKKSIYFNQNFDHSNVFGIDPDSSEGGGEGPFSEITITNDFVIADHERMTIGYYVDTTNGPITITIDATNYSRKASWVKFVDIGRALSRNPVTILTGSTKLEGQVNSGAIWDLDGGMLELAYCDENKGFVITEAIT